MGKWLLVVESNCTDPKKEKEYHDWYNNIHIQDILKTKGFKKATRYQLQEVTKSTGEKAQFLAMYEIEADDLSTVLAKHSENMKSVQAQGRMSKLINSTTRAIYKQIASYPE
jgi:hypothetical protein